MIVFPLIRLVGLKAATASPRVAMLPMFVRSRPSRTRWTISLSWARSDSTTKSTARPSGLGFGLGYPYDRGYYPPDYGYYGYSQPYAATQYWYYCSNPAGYYPSVTQCNTGW